MSITRHKVGRDIWNIDWNIVAQVDTEYADKYLVNLGHVESEDVTCEPLTIELNDYENRMAESMDNNMQNNMRDVHNQENLPNWDIDSITYNSNDIVSIGDSNVPLLPIPKRFLAEGSIMHFGDHLVYSIQSSSRGKNPNVVNLRKQRIMIKEDSVRCIENTYYFDRVGAFTSEKKGSLNFLTFSEKTKGIYWTSYVKYDKKYKKEVARLGLRHVGIDMRLSKIKRQIANQFFAEVIKRARRDLGDIYLPSVEGFVQGVDSQMDIAAPSGRKGLTAEDRKIINIVSNKSNETKSKPKKTNPKNTVLYMAYALSAVTWQYKAGKPLQWVSNRIILANISELLDTSHIQLISRVRWGKEDAQHEVQDYFKWRNKILRKINNMVKSSTSPKVILKAVFGEFYKNVYFTLFDKYSAEALDAMLLDIFHIEVAIQNKKAPKSVYHLLVKIVGVLNSSDIDYDQKVNKFYHLSNLLESLPSYRENAHNPQYPDINLFDKWVKFSSKLFDTEQEPITWLHFRDTFRMASELSIRIRMNKYSSHDEFIQLHDKLSGYIRRDNKMAREFPIFFPFKHPTKEYEGFEFVHIDNSYDLSEEGINMKQCVGNYARSCFEGHSLIFSMRNGRSWITLELSGTNYKIKQQYTVGDFKIVNDDIRNIINTWHRDLRSMHNNDTGDYLSISQYLIRALEKKREGGFVGMLEDAHMFGLSKEETTNYVEKLEALNVQPSESDFYGATLPEMQANLEQLREAIANN